MFERQFGLRENPFAAGHQSRFVYPSREHQEVLAHLRFGIENREPFVLITGEVGTGKTTALYDVLAEYESRAVVALITNSSLTRDELFEEICLRFGLGTGGRPLTKPQALQALESFLRQTRAAGRHAILILDEAQNLERSLLEEVRQLSNIEDQGVCLLQLFLVGQPELEEKLARPELRQLRQRITVFYRVNPLGPEDTEGYIHHRIAVAGGHSISVFPADACHEVFAITHGIPREINTVAGQAMLNAFVEDSPCVKPEHVRVVERDGEFRSVLRGGAAGARIATVDPRAGQSPAVAASAAEASTPVAPPPVAPTPISAPPAIAAPAAATPETAAPAPVSSSAQGPPQMLPMEPIPAQPITSGSTGPPLLPTDAPASAGTAEAWGTWLNLLPSTLEEGAAQTPAASSPPTGAPIARAATPTPDAPQRVEPRNAEPPRTPRVPPAASAEPAARAWSERPEPQHAEPRAPGLKGVDFDDDTDPDSESARDRKPRKLEFIDEEPEEDASHTMRNLIVAGVLVVIAIGGALGIRSWRNAASHAQSLSTAAVPSSGPSSEPSATGTSPPPATGTAPPPSTATTTPTTPGAGGAASGAPANPPPDQTQNVVSPSAGNNAAPAPPAEQPRASIPGSIDTASAPAVSEPPPAVAMLPPVITPPAGNSQSPGTASGNRTTSGSPARPAPTRVVSMPQSTYGVVVGTYLNEERAGVEREKLVASTHLAAQLVTVTENDVAMFRLVMGSFVSRLQAERMASSLIERGLVDEARVIALEASAPAKP